MEMGPPVLPTTLPAAFSKDDQDIVFWGPCLKAGVPYLLTGALFLALSVTLGRVLGPDAYGVVSILLAYLVVLGAICLLGLGVSSVYLLPQFKRDNKPQHVRMFFIPALGVALILGLLGAAIWREVICFATPTSLMAQLSGWMFALLVLFCMVHLLSGLLYSTEKPHLGAITLRPMPYVLWMGMSWALYATYPSSNPADYLFLDGLALVLVVIYQITQLIALWPRTVWHVETLQPLREVLVASFPYYQTGLWSVLGSYIGLLLVHWVISAHLIAYYVAASILAFTLPFLTLQGIQIYSSAQVGNYASQNDLVTLESVLRRLAWATWGVVLVYLVIVCYYAVPLIGLWGKDFEAYAHLIWLLAPLCLVQTVCVILIPLLNAYAPGRTARVLVITTLTQGVLALLGGLLAGVNGFCVGLVATQVLQMILLFRSTRAVTPIGMRWVFGRYQKG